MGPRKLGRILSLTACLALVGLFAGLQVQGDESATTNSFGVTIDAFVSISIETQPSLDDTAVDQADLLNRYFIGTNGFAHFSARVYAISNYEVTASDTVTVTAGSLPGGDYDPNGLLEIQARTFTNDDEACMAATGWKEVPVSPGVSPVVFTGCNTEGGANNYSIANLDLRIDLDNLGDANESNAFQFTVTLTVTDPTP
ncbi:MAG: hypothetical protein ACUVQU_01125 [Candidatus Bipolaricaulia bacterium]